MPEAAEVAVAAGQLAFVAVGRRLDAVHVTHPRTSRAQPTVAFDRFVGHDLIDSARHGKWIVLRFADVSDRLGIHLRMSGQLLAHAPSDEPADRHVHARLVFGARSGPPGPRGAVPAPPPGRSGVDDAPTTVWFRDPRTFGELRVLAEVPVAADLADEAVTGTQLMTHAQTRSVGVKAVLLDQGAGVSGIGSYLADEALHAAGIDPRQRASRLHLAAWTRILDAARDIATRAAAAGGVTLPDEGWIDLWGRPGQFAPHLQVHGQPMCRRCGTATRTATVGGRRARWCPSCQDARRMR